MDNPREEGGGRKEEGANGTGDAREESEFNVIGTQLKCICRGCKYGVKYSGNRILKMMINSAFTC